MFSHTTLLSVLPILPPVGGDARVHHVSKLELETSKVQVDPLRPEHFDKAADSVEKAFKDDPLANYVNENPKQDPRSEKFRKAIWRAIMARTIQNKIAYTVNAGDAVAVATPAAPDRKKPRPVDRLLDLFLAFVIWGILSLAPRETRKRQREVQVKLNRLIECNIGNDINNMLYLDLLATAPECQGRGYGTALVKAVTDIADAQGRSTFLLSSNIANNNFYMSCGFNTIAEAHMGDSNPTWHKPPVVVPLMVRKPKGHDEKVMQLV